MSENWKAGFRKHMIDALVKHGNKVSDNASIYDWQDHSYSSWGTNANVIATIGIDYEKTTFTESSWQEFMGTFYEGDTTVYGVDMQLVLADGVTILEWRYAGKVSDLIQAVLFN